uniref:DNA primase large subunit n=1 Tax=Romanomermis culicivorax TaxID=13658 RepID=A0A915L5Z4_ROMCU
MNLGKTVKQSKIKRRLTAVDNNGGRAFGDALYLKHNLQFYSEIPIDRISLSEVGILAVERQKALRCVESAGQLYPKHSSEYQAYLDTELNKGSMKILRKSMRDVETAELEVVLDCRRKDNLSHFILMLAYCENKETRDWFIAQETDLFKFRYMLESNSSLNNFFEIHNLNIHRISQEDKHKFSMELAESTFNLPKSYTSGNTLRKNFEETAGPEERLQILEGVDFFKTPFETVLNLVRSKKVFLQNGLAYVPRHELITLIAGKFRNKLSHIFAVLTKQQTAFSDPRLNQIFKLVRQKGCSVSTYNVDDESLDVITANMIDGLSQTSFPPCMRNLYTHLHKDRHLRHGGRMQFGLFLKGIGVPLEEALKFWKNEFSPRVDADKFDKQYAYNVRHNYGKEGKRLSYTSYGCMKIITQNPPSSLDYHGCPFKHMDLTVLKQNLKNWSVKATEEQNTIIKLTESKQFDRACSRFFEFTHQLPESSLSQLISHPNQYFEESRKRLAPPKKDIKNEEVENEIPINVDIMD